MNADEIKKYCLEKHGAYETQPFGDVPICYKLNNKIFAQLYPYEHDYKITLKCTADVGDFYRMIYPGKVVRGYHCPPVQQPYCNEYKDAIYCIGSVVGPHPFPMMVRDFQSVVGIEAREQFLDMTGELPNAVVACVGGGSNAMGLFSGFLNDPVDIYGVEPLGRGIKMGDHAASLTYGEEGIMHGFNSIMLKDENGDPAPVYSVASGLDYPSCGPEHAFLHDLGRVKYDVVTDDETIDAFFELSRMEGIIPAIESSHAVAYGIKLAKEMGKGSVLINLSGRGDKDMDYIIERYGIR